jgi:uncharacterized Zn finger protein
VTRQAVTCPAGCGSTSFRTSRKAVIVETIVVDTYGGVGREDLVAEGGGPLRISCENCGRSWTSRSKNPDVRALAVYVGVHS